jgi:hypothetical protein
MNHYSPVVEQTTVNANEPTGSWFGSSVSLTEAIDDQVGIYYTMEKKER